MCIFKSAYFLSWTVKKTIAKMAGVEECDIAKIVSNPPKKVSEEIKYKIAVTVMSLRFFLKDCENE